MIDAAALRAEMGLPAYQGLTDDAALGMLRAAVTVAAQPIAWSAAKLLAKTATTGDWARIVARSRQTPTLPPATATDAAILAAINATQQDDSATIDPADADAWTAFQDGITALTGSGDLAAATVTAIMALATRTTTRAAQIGCGDLVAMDEASALYHIHRARAGA